MARQVTRRALLTVSAAATAASLTACSDALPVLRKPTIPPVPLSGSTPSSGSDAPGSPLPGIANASGVGYLTVAPATMRGGRTEPIGFSLFKDAQPATGAVTVSLLQNGQTVSAVTAKVAGRSSIAFPVPRLTDGQYQLAVTGDGFRDQASVQVVSSPLLFLESDKPVYQPGQVAHFRILSLDPSLRPSATSAILEVADAKGLKIFKQTVAVDVSGLASLDLPLSNEPNLGTWKATVTSGQQSSELDLQIERYVLPKYAVKVTLGREWALASDPIKGTVSAEYRFGKPVQGELEIHAQRYLGTWRDYAQVTKAIDGTASFEIPAVGYAVGTPAAGGMAQVRLDVSVREPATGYSESNSVLVTIATRPVGLRIIPESNTFKPGLPFAMLVVAESPDHATVDTVVDVRLTYQDRTFRTIKTETTRVTTRQGLTTVTLAPPAEATQLFAQASALNADAVPLILRAGYSPTGSFIHVEQVNAGPFKIGDTARFHVHATREAVNFYYEVLARGSVIYSDFSPTADLAIPIVPDLAPEARLLVYQILSNSEVTADFLPFKVVGTYPQHVSLVPNTGEAKPGDTLDLAVQTDGPARVGLVAVDRSVFILAENRLNLQQVFDELEHLYEAPQVELHPAQPINPTAPALNPGAKETFVDAGVVVLSNREIPAGVVPPVLHLAASDAVREGVLPFAAAKQVAAAAPTAAPAAVTTTSGAAPPTLAAAPRIRQFFPETWLWTDLTTDASGRAAIKLNAPDSITTWALRAVAVSQDKGLGIAESQLRVFQPFFVELDLPVSAVRGEELPIKVALYNYQSTAQNFVVDLEHADWFDALDATTKTSTIDANGIGGVSFQIRPTGLGAGSLRVTARSPLAADAIVKELLVEAEGVAREYVDNLVLSPGVSHRLDLQLPADLVAGSERSTLVVTGNVLSQTIDGLDSLLRMPFGCGEQNMILFAPDVFVTRYLRSTGQGKPEVLAKAELLLLTGYQRELTYRRSDGSFSAFGDQDQEGSLWLTAFVLKTFSQARGIIYIDDAVLSAAEVWVKRWQNPDGSFRSVGFLHHPDLAGGLTGGVALTAYVAIALSEAGDVTGAKSAVDYVESQVAALADDYSLAIAAYALALAKSPAANAAHARLLAKARTDSAGLFWGGQAASPTPLPGNPAPVAVGAPPPGTQNSRPSRSATIETTGYAALALLATGDLINAQRAIRWLAAQRNAFGGFDSTQDTVVALQAMTSAATGQRRDVNATVTIQSGGWRKDLKLNPDSADVVQIVELPAGASATVDSQGKGDVMAQFVRRYNLPRAALPATSAFQIDVRYSADQVAINDRIDVTVAIQFTPPEPMRAGMVVLDVAVPTGFTPVTDTLDAAVKQQPKLKRWDLAGRKVIFYIDDLAPNERLLLSFQAQALYPVRAQPVPSRAYAYYHPEWSGETLGKAVVVTATG